MYSRFSELTAFFLHDFVDGKVSVYEWVYRYLFFDPPCFSSRLAMKSQRRRYFQPVRIFYRMNCNLIEDTVYWSKFAPIPERFGFCGVEDHPGNVEGAALRLRAYGMWPKAIIAPFCELPQRHGGFSAAGEIDYAIFRR